MQKALLIAEKPTTKKEFQATYLKHKSEIPYDITFTNMAGHFVELLSPSEINPLYEKWDATMLPIVPEEEGGWQYKVSPNCVKGYSDIKKELQSGKYDVIIHAGDADQEGELLVNLLLNHMHNHLPVIRLWTNAMTEDDILKGYKNMEDDSLPKYRNLYYAALVRQHSDWRFGINGSRALAAKIHTNKDNRIACGRIMTAIQNIIVEREDEINNFVPSTSYGVKITYKNGLEGNLLNTDSTENDKQSLLYFENKDDVTEIINRLNDTSVVTEFQKETVKTYAPKLFSLTDIQGAASSRYHYDVDYTSGLIQSLYEKKYLTYPRTDCRVLSSNDDFDGMLKAVTSLSQFSEYAYLTAEIPRIKTFKKYVNDKELLKHGHTALVPTSVAPDIDALPLDERNIYEMVCERFIAIFLPPLVEEKTVIITENNNFSFRSNGKITVDKGFTDFLKISKTDTDLPIIEKGDTLDVSQTEIVEKTTTCPKRFTGGDIVLLLENPAKFLKDSSLKESAKKTTIGTTATRSGIIKKLIEKDKYIKKEKGGYLKPTEFGSFMIHAIKTIPLCNVDTTILWDEILTSIKEGELDYLDAEHKMAEEVELLLADISKLGETSFGNSSNVVMICPDCGGNIIETSKNFFCTGYKNGCKNSLPKKYVGATFTKDDFTQLLGGKEIEKKLKKDDNSWKQKLTFDRSNGKINFVKKESAIIEKSSLHCPLCHELLSRQGARLKCNCGFNIWTTVAKRELSDDELSYIFEHGCSEHKLELKKSNGKGTFKAKLKLKPGKDSGFIFEF